MHLRSLELSGFKSFAKKTYLDFKTPITAIVGPNGSGKSNAAEAFRFVLGEQSIKSLRGKKTEDLIWNGSKDLSRGNRASVKLVFDNRKKLFDFDYEEVIIERIIYRDSSSEYLINGTQVRLRDIIELLAGAHIGSSGHHIISQGEADRVLSASLKERREMIEDALGLKIYQYKKQESQRKLEKTEENILQVGSLRREIAPHLRFLKKQVEKVEKAQAMKEELIGLYQEYLRREDIYFAHEKHSIAEARHEPASRLEKLQRELVKAKEVVALGGNKDGYSEHLIILEGELQTDRQEKERLTREVGRLEGVIDLEKRRLAKAESAETASAETVISLNSVEILNQELKDEAISVDSVNDLQSLRDLVRSLLSKIEKFIVQNRRKQNESTSQEIREELKDLEAGRVKLEAEIKATLGKEASHQEEYQKLKTSIEARKDENQEAEKAIFRIMAEQNEIHAKLSVLTAREDKLVLETENFKREIQEGLVLVGRGISEYHNYRLKNDSGEELKPQEVVLEPRAKQEDRRRVIEKIKIRLEDSGGGSSDEIMKEYQDVSGRDEFLAHELEDLGKSAESLQDLIKDLELRLDNEFKEGVAKINKQFKEFFSLMFGGGEASLQIVKEVKRRSVDDDLSDSLETMESGEEVEKISEGLDINVSLPRKKIKGLMMLSGGERALTSIALIFAVSQVNPPPFIILDETDAALDEANSRKYGDMIENLAKHSQLILITHNRETMSRAGVLYGVTMASGGDSKLLSVEFDEAVAVAK